MARLSIENSIIVNASPEAAFERMNDPLTISQWFSVPIEVRGFVPPLEVGNSYETVMTFMGREISSQCEVLEIRAPSLFRFRMSGMVNGETQHIFEAVAGGTKITVRVEGEAGGFLAAIATPIMKGVANRQMRADLKNFKAYVEAG